MSDAHNSCQFGLSLSGLKLGLSLSSLRNRWASIRQEDSALRGSPALPGAVAADVVTGDGFASVFREGGVMRASATDVLCVVVVFVSPLRMPVPLPLPFPIPFPIPSPLPLP